MKIYTKTISVPIATFGSKEEAARFREQAALAARRFVAFSAAVKKFIRGVTNGL